MHTKSEEGAIVLPESHPYLQGPPDDLWLVETEREHLRISYHIKEVLYSSQSAVQHVMILDSYDFGPMLVLDGVVQTTSLDGFIYNEMISHVPLTMHPKPRRVLIIGGGDLGAANEVCKYKDVETIDLVEIDQAVVNVCREYLQDVSAGLNDPRVNYYYEDGVRFVATKKDSYDLVIVDSSDPVGPAVQLFSEPFYRGIKAALRTDGMMVCQSQSPIFHQDVMAASFNHLRGLFVKTQLYTAVVPTYPGGLWSFTVGSKLYDRAAAERLPSDTKYVNAEILQRCFALPNFLETSLFG